MIHQLLPVNIPLSFIKVPVNKSKKKLDNKHYGLNYITKKKTIKPQSAFIPGDHKTPSSATVKPTTHLEECLHM